MHRCSWFLGFFARLPSTTRSFVASLLRTVRNGYGEFLIGHRRRSSARSTPIRSCGILAQSWPRGDEPIPTIHAALASSPPSRDRRRHPQVCARRGRPGRARRRPRWTSRSRSSGPATTGCSKPLPAIARPATATAPTASPTTSVTRYAWIQFCDPVPAVAPECVRREPEAVRPRAVRTRSVTAIGRALPLTRVLHRGRETRSRTWPRCPVPHRASGLPRPDARHSPVRPT